jgi:hypothetical protein
MILAELFGSKTAELVFLYLYHYKEAHARGIARDLNTGFSQVERQLKKYERAGLFISKEVGKSRVYLFNKKYVLHEPVLAMIKKVYDSIPLSEHKVMFQTRRQPRRSDKPVIRNK